MSQYSGAFYGCPDATDRKVDNAFFACHATITDLRKLIRGFQSGIIIEKYTDTVGAAKYGYLDVLIYLRSLGSKIKWTSFGYTELDASIENSHIEVAKFLWDIGIRYTRTSAYLAAKNGRLDIFTWIYEKDNEIRQTNCYWDKSFAFAMYHAAQKGHLHIIRWLHENCDFQIKDHVIREAAGNGHFECVRWFVDNKYPIEYDALASAARNGHFEIARYLLDEYEKYQRLNYEK
jgi:ankyrin repeat protein